MGVAGRRLLITIGLQIKSAGEFCWNVDLGTLSIGLTNGSLVTLQIQYDGVYMLLYLR